jgi:SAM-dependent methyltransferase
MTISQMRIDAPQVTLVANEREIMDGLLHLKNVRVLELGCGAAEKTRLVAQKAASVLALEVDEVQLAKNRMIGDLPNVRFEFGGAESIPAADASFDIVLMFKSLHHVPSESLDKAFSEICRVLKAGGVAYISEPVYAGEFNEILRLFHDEKKVREAAFAAEARAVSTGRLTLLQQKFFLQPVHFDSFGQFENQVLKVTHTEHRLSPALFEEVRSKFNRHMSPTGAEFLAPMRIDLFTKPVP